MEDFNKWTVPELKALLLQYDISPNEIKGTGKNNNVIKADLIKAVKKVIKREVKRDIKNETKNNVKTIDLNQDVCYNLLLNADINDIVNLCSVNKSCHQACHVNFWKTKIQNDFDINIPENINPKTINEWVFLYKQMNKLVNRLDNLDIYIKFKVTDNVLYDIQNIFSSSDLYFIQMAEERDVIKQQFIRSSLDDHLIDVQYTEVGEHDYYTINTKINKDKFIEILITILYYYPDVNLL